MAEGGTEWALRSLQPKPFHDFHRATGVRSTNPSPLEGVLAEICWDNLGAVRSSFTFPNTSWRFPLGGQECVLRSSESGSGAISELGWAGWLLGRFEPYPLGVRRPPGQEIHAFSRPWLPGSVPTRMRCQREHTGCGSTL